MDIKLFAFDLDGTTIDNDHVSISQRNLEALAALSKKGVLLVPSTGRARGRLPSSLKKLDIRYLITSNGAKLTEFSTGKTLYEKTITFSLVEQLLCALEPHRLYMELYYEGCCYADAAREPFFHSLPIPPQRRAMMEQNRLVRPNLLQFLRTGQHGIEKLNLPMLLPVQRQPVRALLDSFPNIAVTSSLPENMEINAQDCNKGAALAFLCSRLGLDPAYVMAMGDNGNDVEMLKFAGIAVAPANAAECAKAQAQALPVSNTEDAVAVAIENLIHI